MQAEVRGHPQNEKNLKKYGKTEKEMVKTSDSYATELAGVSLAKTHRARYREARQHRGWLHLLLISVGWERRSLGSSRVRGGSTILPVIF